MTTATKATPQRLEPLPQGVGGYDQNWYPVCLSTDIPMGGSTFTPFLNGHVVVLRGADGEARVLSGYCRHLGASLRNAPVQNGELVCPYHAYRYNSDGMCVATGVGDAPPKKARLLRFPTHESCGVVWAFNGETPLYAPPSFEVPEAELLHTASFDQVNSVDHTLMFSNSIDVQHFRVLHGVNAGDVKNFTELDHGMTYQTIFPLPGIGDVQITIRLFGTNCLTLDRTVFGHRIFNFIAGKPLPGNRTETLAVTAIKPAEGTPPAAAAQLLREEHLRIIAFNRQDDDIFEYIRFKIDCLTQSDKYLLWYFNYAASYPRSDWAQDLIG